MGTYIRRLPDPIEGFVMAFWDTDVREQVPSSTARGDLRRGGIEADVKAFLSDVILRDAVSPEEWRKLVNVKTWTHEDVRKDASEFWLWLFNGSPLPADGGDAGAISPPQV